MTELADPSDPEAAALLDRLSGELQARYGSDGRSSFGTWDARDSRYIFVLARKDGRAVGCGAVRPIDAATGEVKRMYSLEPGIGTGTEILCRLCAEAAERGYGRLWLETRKANRRAIAFYEGFGFRRRDNFGGYIGRDECICFELELAERAP